MSERPEQNHVVLSPELGDNRDGAGTAAVFPLRAAGQKRRQPSARPALPELTASRCSVSSSLGSRGRRAPPDSPTARLTAVPRRRLGAPRRGRHRSQGFCRPVERCPAGHAAPSAAQALATVPREHRGAQTWEGSLHKPCTSPRRLRAPPSPNSSPRTGNRFRR